jgi:hypothetical protein
MYARPLFVVVGISEGFSSEVDAVRAGKTHRAKKSRPYFARFDPSAPLFFGCSLASP